MLGNYQVATQLVISRVVPSSIELVSAMIFLQYLLWCLFINGLPT
jgi:hypothetical protein